MSEEEKHRRTLAGLADIAEGRVTEHAEVLRWADQLVRGEQAPPPLIPAKAGTQGFPSKC